MSEYRDLQTKAAELGMEKVVGKTAEELEAFIASKDNTPEPRKEIEKYNTAIVMNGNIEVRRYTVETHGKEFANLAASFTQKHSDYRIDMKYVEKPVCCPKCGTEIIIG